MSEVPFNANMAVLAEDIIALFPNGVPAEHAERMRKIMTQVGVITGIIGALQETAGEVFSQHARGNHAIAETFYDALLAITVPNIDRR